MASGDGWLIRLRTSARALGSGELRQLAELASVHGNGIVELTRRANLQLRGLRLERIPELRSELIALGLVNASPEREARPALVVDPVAALDPHSGVDELAQLLDACLLEHAADGVKLSPKLGIVLDAGSGSVSNIAADIRVLTSGPRVQFYVSTPAGEQQLAECERTVAPGALRKLLVALGGPSMRMRELVAVRGLYGLRAALAPLLAAGPGRAAPRSAPPPQAALGFSGTWFGLAVPFGAGSHDQWLAIAELAERFGVGAVRFTPAREVLIAGVCSERAAELAYAAHAQGLISDARDPRRRIVACSGAPACSSSYGETRVLASLLAVQASQLLAAGATLHVSGCEKGCACREPTELNVVLAPDDCARLALNADIAAASSAAAQPVAVVSKRLSQLGREYDPQVSIRSRST